MVKDLKQEIKVQPLENVKKINPMMFTQGPLVGIWNTWNWNMTTSLQPTH